MDHMRAPNHHTNQNTKNIGNEVSIVAEGLPEPTSGAANPIVEFKHSNNAASCVPKTGKGVSGVPSAEYAAVLL
jgi:hypothetical protein